MIIHNPKHYKTLVKSKISASLGAIICRVLRFSLIRMHLQIYAFASVLVYNLYNKGTMLLSNTHLKLIN